ncbi:unnamed protein product [Rhizopus stolonifer]
MSESPNEIVNNILQTLKTSSNNSTGQTLAFFNAIDWSERWIQSLLAFHIVCFIILLYTRNRSNGLSIYFFVLLGLAALTQPLNSLGMTYWKLFSKAPYFEKSGIFIVSVYAAPLLINAFFTLIFILKSTISLMIVAKRKQLQQKVKKS